MEKQMNTSKLWSVFISVVVLSGCASTTGPANNRALLYDLPLHDSTRLWQVPSEKIPSAVTDRFLRAKAGTPEFTSLVRSCVVDITQTSIEQWSSKTLSTLTSFLTMRDSKTAGFLVAHQGESGCIRQTDLGHPIFPAEAFFESATPNGVPEEVALNWFKQISIQIAQTGRAEVVFKYPNGNFSAVQYFYESNSPAFIQYKQTFHRLGESMNVRALQFSDPRITSVSTISTAGRNQKFAFAKPRLSNQKPAEEFKSAANQI
jgi:hypothetical protein